MCPSGSPVVLCAYVSLSFCLRCLELLCNALRFVSERLVVALKEAGEAMLGQGVWRRSKKAGVRLSETGLVIRRRRHGISCRSSWCSCP